MILSFKCKESKKIFHREYSRKFQTSIQRISMRKLWMIDSAISLSDLCVPLSNCLESLKGKRKGQYSIRVNDQWRVCFKWKNGNAYNVEIIDYH